MTAHIGANLARSIGANVLEIADRRGWNTHRIGDEAGIRGSQLASMISGDVAFNTDHLVKLAIALEVTVGDLLSGIAPEAEPEVARLRQSTSRRSCTRPAAKDGL